jgi:Protein of unknown function (DUF2442)
VIHVVSAKPLSEYRLDVTFNDGVRGVFPVEPEKRGGVFLKLLDKKIFDAVSINPDFGCVEWPGGVDLDPEAMHRTMKGSRYEMQPRSAEALHEGDKEH